MASPSLVIRRIVVEGEISCDLQFERMAWGDGRNPEPSFTLRR